MTCQSSVIVNSSNTIKCQKALGNLIFVLRSPNKGQVGLAVHLDDEQREIRSYFTQTCISVCLLHASAVSIFMSPSARVFLGVCVGWGIMLMGQMSLCLVT